MLIFSTLGLPATVVAVAWVAAHCSSQHSKQKPWPRHLPFTRVTMEQGPCPDTAGQYSDEL